MEELLERSRDFLAPPAAAVTPRERRKRQAKIVVVVALACFVVKTSSGHAAQTQTLGLGVTPTKLKKNRKSPVAVTITAVTANETAPNRIPSPTTIARFNFDDDFHFNGTSGVTGTCEPEMVENLSTALAIQQCPNAVLGSGSAKARFPWLLNGNPWYQEVDAELTAFKGSPDPGTGYPRLVIFTRVETAGFGSSLLGTLKPAGAGPDFGTRLEITVPEFISGFAALTRFSIKIGTGAGRGYASAKCSDRDHRLNLNGRITYKNGSTLPAKASSRCFPV